MIKKFLAFSSFLLLLAACAVDKPAPAERKERLYYGQSGIVQLVRVSRSQSIKEIAYNYGVDVELLAKFNRRSTNALIASGEVIKVPLSPDIQFEEHYHTESESPDYYGDIEGSPLSEETIEVKERWILGDEELEKDLRGAKTAGEQISSQSANEQAKNEKHKSIQKSSFKYPNPLNSKKFIWPVDGKVISHYGKSQSGFNEGITISAPIGSVVRAAADGEVLHADKEPKVYGNLVILKHSGNYLTAYAHNDKINVKKGMKVKQGQPIATVGKSGAAKSPQLHFLIRKNKKTIDPEGLAVSQ